MPALITQTATASVTIGSTCTLQPKIGIPVSSACTAAVSIIARSLISRSFSGTINVMLAQASNSPEAALLAQQATTWFVAARYDRAAVRTSMPNAAACPDRMPAQSPFPAKTAQSAPSPAPFAFIPFITERS